MFSPRCTILWCITTGPILIYDLLPTHDGQFQTHGLLVSQGQAFQLLWGPTSMVEALLQKVHNPLLQIMWPCSITPGACVLILPLELAIHFTPYMFLLLIPKCYRVCWDLCSKQMGLLLALQSGPAAEPFSTPSSTQSWHLPYGLEQFS